jgi:hypothetical protein
MNWVFQCNPKRFDLCAELKKGITAGHWSAKQHKREISPGDRVFFWQTGNDARLLACGHVTSSVYEGEENEFGRSRVDISFDSKIVPPLTRLEILDMKSPEGKVLAGFPAFTAAGRQGTNIQIGDPTVAALTRILETRLIPLSTRAADKDAEDVERSLSDAIRRAEQETTEKLRAHIAKLESTTFEWLVAFLLVKLEYKNVVVTKQTGDHGIDITAKLVARGVTDIQTGVQVKRQQSGVGRPAIQNLRGALGPHQVGLFVTSSHFTKEAKAEAKDSTKAPIALIDGAQLIKLLMSCKIGAEHRQVTLHHFTPKGLSQDELEAGVEAGVEEGEEELDADSV